MSAAAAINGWPSARRHLSVAGSAAPTSVLLDMDGLLRSSIIGLALVHVLDLATTVAGLALGASERTWYYLGLLSVMGPGGLLVAAGVEMVLVAGTAGWLSRFGRAGQAAGLALVLGHTGYLATVVVSNARIISVLLG